MVENSNVKTYTHVGGNLDVAAVGNLAAGVAFAWAGWRTSSHQLRKLSVPALNATLCVVRNKSTKVQNDKPRMRVASY